MVDDEIDPELQRLRMKRMQNILAMKERQKQLEDYEKNKPAAPTLDDKIDRVLSVIMMPDAYAYYNSKKSSNNNLYLRLREALLPPQVLAEIDMLLSYLSQGMLKTGIISLIDVQYLERQILGIGSQITIKKRNGESKSLGSFLKED